MTARSRRPPAWLLNGLLPFDPASVPSEVIAGARSRRWRSPRSWATRRSPGRRSITGLYTILLPVALFAIFGSSRHLVVGADSATAAIMATGLVGHGRRRRLDRSTSRWPRWRR